MSSARTVPPVTDTGDLGSQGTPPRSRAHRPDIDGLRALAILLVVAFHAGIPKVGGGFVGVDVFFVISGYLITRNLVHEAETTGRVALGTFWAKRLRRLVPALGLVVVATLLASLLVLPLFRWAGVARQGAAASLYMSNFLFFRDSEDYFASEVGESPFLHTWSLGIEEQFYVVWPILFVVVLALVRRRPDRTRTTLGIAFAVTLLGSFAASVVTTPDRSAFAFYLLPTRAWEFAVAGLLALVVLPGAWGRPWVRWASAIGGLGMVVAAGFKMSASTAYPGYWAMIPVLGTVLLMASGDPAPGGPTILPARMLALGPVQWLGRVSYSWYLWHWPAIILTVAAVGEDSVALRSAAVVASLGVAHLTYRYYENPVRFSPTLTGSNGRTIGLAAVASVLVIALAFGVSELAHRRVGGDSIEARLAASRLKPDPLDCDPVQRSESGVEHCLVGDVDAPRTVMLLGDSHAGQWAHAMDAAATQAEVRLVYHWRGGCPILDVYVSVRGQAMDPGCIRHRAESRDLIEELRPDLVVVAHSAEIRDRLRGPGGAQISGAEAVSTWGGALDRFVAELDAMGVATAVVIDNPVPGTDPAECIAREGATEPCEPTLAESLDRTRPLRRAEEVVVDARGLASLDLNPDFCDAERCAVELDGILVYSDRGHLSRELTMSFVPRLSEFLTEALAGSAGWSTD